MQSWCPLLFVVLTGVAGPAVAPTRARLPEHITVLFLGDRGHHEPEVRADVLMRALAPLGIDLFFTDDRAALHPANLARYDALLIYANQDQIAPSEEQALLDFVEEGKGLVAVHCASYCFLNSERYLALVGGRFHHHGMGPFTARTLLADHPAMRGVPEFATTDETYVHEKLGPDLTLLQVRDEGGTAEPYTWVRDQGKGRVYYTALGHDLVTWGQSAFQQQLAQAIRWAAGKPDFTFTSPALTYTAGKLPNYVPGAPWSTEGDAIAQVQAPLTPAQSRELMQVLPGFDVGLFAAEPDVVKPIALAFDWRGRLWIAESVDYPNERAEEGKGHDRIKILEDTDHDGRVDAVKVFAEGLSLPTSLVCVSGPTTRGSAVIVAQMPDVLLLEDADGDDRADTRRVLFTGFGTSDTHAGPSNFRFGPDGWIWGTVGYSGFDGVVGGQQHRFFQTVFRFKPDGSRLERVASTTNNTWGLGFGADGEVFASTANNDHLVHVVLPLQALDGVEGLVADATVHVPDHRLIHPLTALRQVDAFGGFTAAAGAAICNDHAFPSEWWNRVAFVCEPTGHLVHCCTLERRGASFTAHDGRNLLASRDEWTAPIAAEFGPDGALWVLDWYTPVVQHNPTPHGFKTGRGNAYETPLRDKGHGRIWRVTWSDAAKRALPIAQPSGRDDPAWKALAAQSTLGLWTFDRLLEEQASGLNGVAAAAKVADARPHPDPTRILYKPQDPALRSGVTAAELAALLLRRFDSDEFVADRMVGLAALVEAARLHHEFLSAALAPVATDVRATRGSRAAAAEPAPKNLLANGDFEQGGLLPAAQASDGWHFVQYGGRAVPSVVAGGRGSSGRCLRITSTDGADASCSQMVKVAPNGRYRLSAWIKTDGIVPVANGYGALLNIHELQNPRIVTPAVVGSRDWTSVQVEFDVGSLESITVNCLLGGWGRAKGNAWWDDVSLELLTPGSPRTTAVRRVAAHAARVDPLATFELVLPRLADAAPDAAAAVLEGLASGWQRTRDGGLLLVPTKEQEQQLRALPARLDDAGRGAFLGFAERCGLISLFHDEVAELLDELATTLADGNAVVEERVAAASRLLALAPAADGVAQVAAELTTIADPELVKGLLAALSDSGAEEVGPALVGRLRELTPAAMPTAVELLLRRPRWTAALLRAVLAGKFDARNLSTDVRDRLSRNKDPEVAALAAEVAQISGRKPKADRQKLLDSFLPIAEKPGNAERGAVVFAAQCAKCHTVNGTGGPVGPDLTGIGARSRSELLLEILDPNRSVEGTYRAFDVTLKNGDSFSGRLVAESRTTIELVDATGARKPVARDQIEELRALERSLMPEGFEELGEEDLEALLEYLATAAAPKR